uniref:Mitochondria-eating protein n=1 Tax=Ascaris lumbricoides TaxID=6252 RepID=A0A9J2P5T5_ASCLU
MRKFYLQMQKNECVLSERLCCKELFAQLLWWSAYVEENAVPDARATPSASHLTCSAINLCHRSAHFGHSPLWKANIRSLLGVVWRFRPNVLQLAHCQRLQLAGCLEALGCHGLVNCSTGLIRLPDAVQLECERHLEKIKAILAELKDVYDVKQSLAVFSYIIIDVSLSESSHQRQMGLRLSDLLQRLKQNEALGNVLDEILTNNQLSSLLRIIRKRVYSDRMLLTIYNMLSRAAPPGFEFIDIDPIIPKLMVAFKNAYDKLLRESPFECDSGSRNNDTGDRCSMSGPTAVTCDHCLTSTSPESRSPICSSSNLHIGNDKCAISCCPPVEQNHKTVISESVNQSANHIDESPNINSTNYCNTQRAHHNSLRDISRIKANAKVCLKPTRSLSCLSIIGQYFEENSSCCGLECNKNKRDNLGDSRFMLQRNRFLPDGCSSMDNDPEESIRLRAKVNRLSKELFEARRQIKLLSSSPQMRKLALHCPLPEPDYPNAVEYYSQSTLDETTRTVQRFSELFSRERAEIMKALNGLPEFAGSEELQLKTILSVIVLTYRSVHDSVERRRESIFNILGEGSSGKLNDQQLDTALYRFMYRKAKCEHGMANAKEVTSQIWKTLYDFPSLKTCTKFNRFILECVAVVWDLVAGIDGKMPSLTQFACNSFLKRPQKGQHLANCECFFISSEQTRLNEESRIGDVYPVSVIAIDVRKEFINIFMMMIEYESRHFDPAKHQLYSNECSPSVVIKQYLWPALLDTSTGECWLRGIVIT